jgi:hypothetical protein
MNGRELTAGFKQHTDTFSGIYRAKILDNIDPDMLGRVKAQVYPMLADIEAAGLPWAVPAYPIWEGSGNGTGYFAVPDIDSFVFVFFEQGDIYQPVYFAEAPTRTKGLPVDRITNYPNRKVMQTTSGIVFMVDDTAKVITVLHPTGTSMTITTDGQIFVNSPNHIFINGLTINLNPI